MSRFAVPTSVHFPLRLSEPITEAPSVAPAPVFSFSSEPQRLPETKKELEARFLDIIDAEFNKTSAIAEKHRPTLKTKFLRELHRDLAGKGFEVEQPERYVTQKLADFIKAHILPWRKEEVRELQDRFKSFIEHRATKAFTRDHGRVEDLTQEVLVKLGSTGHRYDPTKGRAFTWVKLITDRQIIDYLRRDKSKSPNGKRFAELQEGSAEAKRDITTSGPINADLFRHVMGKAAEVLPPDQFYVLKRQYLDGKSLRDISAEQNIPLGTVKSQLSRALTKLRTLLAPIEE